MQKKLSYNVYYAKQMQFIDRYIRSDFDENDKERLNRVKKKQHQQSIHFLDDFLNIEQGKELDTTRIGYPPLDTVSYKPSELVLAPAAHTIRPENRRLSRYRLVYGPVDFYLGSQLERPTEIPVITACAPNLLGSSRVDLDEFSIGGECNRRLKVKEYGTECNKLAEFIVGTAKQQEHTRLIMPAFGVGIYISKLDKASKKIAREKMYSAFAEAALKHQIQIDWIVWAGDPNSAQTAKTLARYSAKNPSMQPVIHEDMMLYAQEFATGQEKIVVLNPGSDRTIGGAYTTKHPRTLEEQMAQQSDLVLLHSQSNQPMVEQFKEEFAQRKQLQQSSIGKQQPSAIGVHKTHSSHTFFPKHTVNSCFSREQYKEIKTLIRALKIEKTSFWSLNHDRKDIKIKALTMLLTDSVNYDDVHELAKQVLIKYPDANKGILSNRTGELLLRLRDQSEPFAPSY